MNLRGNCTVLVKNEHIHPNRQRKFLLALFGIWIVSWVKNQNFEYLHPIGDVNLIGLKMEVLWQNVLWIIIYNIVLCKL